MDVGWDIQPSAIQMASLWCAYMEPQVRPDSSLLSTTQLELRGLH